MAVVLPPVAHGRTERQRFEALALANDVRIHRAVTKRRLKVGLTRFHEVLEDPRCATMKIHDVLRALPYVGAGKAGRALALARVAPSKTVAGLTPRQREAIVEELNRYPSIRRAKVLG